MTEEIECKLDIGAPDAQGGRPLHFTDRRGGKPVEGRLDMDDLTRRTIERLSHWVARSDFVREDLEVLGEHLFNALFEAQGRIREEFEREYSSFVEAKRAAEAAGKKSPRFRLTLRFQEKFGELASYPWEFLYRREPEGGGGSFLAGDETQLVLTRAVVRGDAVAQLLQEGEKLRILIAYCHPRELDPLDKAGEIISKIQVLAANRADIQVVDVLDNPTAEAIEAALGRHQPHVFHFIGHGRTGGISVLATPGEIQARKLDLPRGSDEAPAQAKELPPRAVSSLFKAHKPRLVFLQACEGARSAGAECWTAASRMVADGIPAVIAMQFSIEVGDAELFASTFYARVFEGASVDDAVSEGRHKLGTEREGRSVDAWCDRRFGTPVIYLQVRHAVLCQPAPKERDGGDSVLVRCPKPACRGMLELEKQCCGDCGQWVTPCPTGCGQLVLPGKFCRGCGYDSSKLAGETAPGRAASTTPGGEAPSPRPRGQSSSQTHHAPGGPHDVRKDQ